MLFFGLLTVVSALAAAVAWVFGLPIDASEAVRWGLAASLIFFGIDHLAVPSRYLAMIPRIVLAPRFVVLFTGLCEIAGGIGLFIPELRVAAGWALAAYFVCVFPANIRNAVEGLSVNGLPVSRTYYWLRLPLQPVAIWASLFAAGIVIWPLAA